MNDTEAQEVLDIVSRIEAVPTILDVVCRTTGMGFAAVARVTEGRWIACGVRDEIAFGVQPGEEMNVEITICHDVRNTRAPIIINHVDEDPVYRNHPASVMYGFQSYISMPIILPGGMLFGTLCAFDRKPAKLDKPESVGMFRLFAELLAYQIDTANRMTRNDADLVNERRVAELREVFISILGHDLRNPISAISSGTQLLQRMSLSDKANTVLDMMQRSVGRMTELVGNMLDLARGRLEGGIPIRKTAGVVLKPLLAQIVSEVEIAHPERKVESRLSAIEPVTCDGSRIGQMFSNLLANAITHGAPEQPIVTEARTADGVFSLAVANGGHPIPADRLEHLFEPFSRGSLTRDQHGLGLHIASEIARAHDGTLRVTSTPEETRFTFRMPVYSPASIKA